MLLLFPPGWKRFASMPRCGLIQLPPRKPHKIVNEIQKLPAQMFYFHTVFGEGQNSFVLFSDMVSWWIKNVFSLVCGNKHCCICFTNREYIYFRIETIFWIKMRNQIQMNRFKIHFVGGFTIIRPASLAMKWSSHFENHGMLINYTDKPFSRKSIAVNFSDRRNEYYREIVANDSSRRIVSWYYSWIKT